MGPINPDAREAIKTADVECLLWALRTSLGRPAGAPDRRGVTAVGLYSAARLNKIGNLVEPALVELDGSEGQQLRTLLQDYRRRTILLNAAALGATLEIVATLEKDGMPFAIVKGPLQQLAIHGDCFAKPSGDVDILVGAGDYARAAAALGRIGFAVDARSRSLWWRFFLGEQHFVRQAAQRATADLHYRLDQPGSPGPRHTAAFLQRRRSIAFTGAQIPVLAHPDACLLAAISVVKALFNREGSVGHLVDLWRAVEGMAEAGREALLDLAAEQGLAPTLLFALRAANLVIDRIASRLSSLADGVLAGVPDADLLRIVSQPWDATLDLPRRRDVLWVLCGRNTLRYAREVCWASASEIGRRLFQPAEDDRGKAREAPAGRG